MASENKFCKSYTDDYRSLIELCNEFKELRAKSTEENKSELWESKKRISGLYWDMADGLNGFQTRKLVNTNNQLKNRWKELVKLLKGLLPNKEDEKYWNLSKEILMIQEQMDNIPQEDALLDEKFVKIRKKQKEYPRLY
jgi:predicted nuclease with TOPRIM domain